MESERLRTEGRYEAARIVRLMHDALKDNDYGWLKELNNRLLIPLHGLSLSVVSGQGWDGAQLRIVPSAEAPSFEMSPETKAAQPPVKATSERYEMSATPIVFDDGWAIDRRDEHGVETVAVVNGKVRAEMLVQMLEKVSAEGLLDMWTETFESALEANDGNVDAAKKIADLAVAGAIMKS